MSKDNSLQLLLIVDYIFDWARDIYRPSNLRQLKSIVTGSAFDQISLTDDSDIVSMRRNISNWIQAPPSTVAALDFNQDSRERSIPPILNHQSLLPLPMPNTKLGTLHSAALVESRVEGLYITEQNVIRLLQLSGGEEPARRLLNFLSKWDELFLLTGDDLDDLEEVWTGKLRTAEEASASSTSSKFYVLIEMRTFMNTLWTIVREITYLAVSEAAFEIIVKYANFKIQHDGSQLVPKAGRLCSRKIFTETLKCLTSGSPAQLFIAAAACTNLSLYCLPEQKRNDYTPPVEVLGFAHIRRPRLSWIIQRFHKISNRKERAKPRIPREVMYLPPDQRSNWLKERHPKYQVPDPKDLSFIRISERMGHASEMDYHEEILCERRLHGRKYYKKQHHLTASSHDVVPAYGLNLVVSLNLVGDNVDKNDVCLFAIANLPELTDDVGLSVIVEDLIQSGYVYHTIRHPIPSSFESYVSAGDTIWNSPLSYWPISDNEKIDIADWVNELNGYPISVAAEKKSLKYRWDNLQLLLHFLGEGKTWAEADQEVKLRKQSGKTSRDVVYMESGREAKRRRTEAGEGVEPEPITRWGPSPSSTRRDDPIPYYNAWPFMGGL